MAMKVYSTFYIAPVLESHNQIEKSYPSADIQSVHSTVPVDLALQRKQIMIISKISFSDYKIMEMC